MVIADYLCGETSEPDFPKKMRLVELTIAVLRGLGILCGDFRAEVCAANHIDQQAPSRGVCLESDVLGTTNLTVEMAAGSQKPILSLSSFRSSKSPICPTARSLRNPSLDTATSVECSAASQIHGYLLAWLSPALGFKYNGFAMSVGNRITATEFAAFLNCPTKGHLMGAGESAPRALFTDIEAHISSMYKATLKRQTSIGASTANILHWDRLSPEREHKAISYHIDSDTVIYDLELPPPRPKAPTSQKSQPSASYVPVLLSPWEKPSPFDSLLLCFGALALSQATGTLPDSGILIYGDGPRHRNVKIGDHLTRTRQTIEAIRLFRRGREPPPLILNRHCAVCDFQPRCRNLAIERDELSLLSAMTSKERTKYAAKGVVTITQLSYGYRPRRRKRTRPDAERSAKTARLTSPASKNDHKLRALAIKKKQIHVVGALPMKLDGVPVFFDVEGMPDRDFYYLVGLRFESDGEWVERSFWANDLDDERLMWENCFKTLKAIGDVQIVSYGAYEARFLRRMRDRYVLSSGDLEIVDQIIASSLNLVGWIYAKVYFPTYSNSLKEVGRYLGYEWTWAEASGAAAPLLRRAWELGAGDDLKLDLIGYNMDDCRAATKVTNALMRISNGTDSDLNKVDVSSLEIGFQRTFGRLDSALPEFKKINDAAYWDYQRSKVYARTEKVIRRTVRDSQRRNKSTSVEREIAVANMPERCPRCDSTRFWTYRGGSAHIVYDLKFTRRGIKRWAQRYSYSMYRYAACRFVRERRDENIASRGGVNVVELAKPVEIIVVHA